MERIALSGSSGAVAFYSVLTPIGSVLECVEGILKRSSFFFDWYYLLRSNPMLTPISIRALLLLVGRCRRCEELHAIVSGLDIFREEFIPRVSRAHFVANMR